MPLNWSLLTSNVTSDERPVPGYIFNDIANATHESITICEQLADWLVVRLKQSDPNIRWKALVVIKHVSRLGRAEFRRNMQARKEAIKECLQFRGKPHPLKGDALNKRVRDAAKDAIAAIYTEGPATTGGSHIRTGGVGSDAVGSASGGGAPSSSIFARAGASWSSRADASPSTAAASSSSTGRVTSKGTYAGHVGTSQYGGVGSHPPPSGVSGGGDVGSSITGAITSMFTVSTTASSGPPPRSPNRGNYGAPPRVSPGAPVTGGSFGSASARSPGAVGGAWGSSGPSSIGGGGRGGGGGGGFRGGVVGEVKSDGSYERQLVEGVTRAGGVRANPDAAKVNGLIEAARTLDKDHLLAAFDERLSSEPWQTAQKACAVLEAFGKQAGPGGKWEGDPKLTALRTHFAENCDGLLEVLEEHDRATTRRAAAKALRALGVQGIELEAAAAGSGTPDLGPATTTTTQSQTQTTAPAPAHHQVDDGEDDEDLLGVRPSDAPKPSTDDSMDLFSSMSLGASASSSAPATKPTTTSTSSSGDMFGSMQVVSSGGATSSAPQDTSGFSFTDPSSSSSAAPVADSGFSFTASASEPSDAFDFTAPTTATTTAPSPPKPQPPKPAPSASIDVAALYAASSVSSAPPLGGAQPGMAPWAAAGVPGMAPFPGSSGPMMPQQGGMGMMGGMRPQIPSGFMAPPAPQRAAPPPDPTPKPQGSKADPSDPFAFVDNQF